MIVTRLIGGLGNQMFQYAAGLGLASRLSAELVVDKTWLEGEGQHYTTPRQYELGPFCLEERFASPRLVERFLRRGEGGLSRLRARTKIAPATVLRQQEPAFDTRFETLTGDVLLVGYWQSEKYFADCAEAIRAAFALKNEPSQRNRDLITQLNATNSLSLHVRRGDYASHEETGRFHGLMPVSYYREAVELVTEKAGRVEIFVFSDDIDWCKHELEIPGQTLHFVDHNTRGSEDMRLMSCCRHHILANSSFSWWGAWLNPDPEKIVVAPARWFQDLSLDTSDLLPESWLRV